jgi:hypothetical protein
MNRVVAGFVSQITELARRAAIDTLESALGKRGSTPGLRVRGGLRTRGAKRTSGELEKIGERFLDYVGKHPGLRIEEINKQLGTTTKDLALPIRKMIADGEIKTKGEKRSTTYFAK